MGEWLGEASQNSKWCKGLLAHSQVGIEWETEKALTYADTDQQYLKHWGVINTVLVMNPNHSNMGAAMK